MPVAGWMLPIWLVFWHRHYEELTVGDVLLAMAGMERTPGVGGAVPRPVIVDAFQQRHGLPSKDES